MKRSIELKILQRKKAVKSDRIYNYVLQNCKVTRTGTYYRAVIKMCGRQFVEVAELNYLAARKLAEEISVSKFVQLHFKGLPEQPLLFSVEEFEIKKARAEEKE